MHRLEKCLDLGVRQAGFISQSQCLLSVQPGADDLSNCQIGIIMVSLVGLSRGFLETMSLKCLPWCMAHGGVS